MRTRRKFFGGNRRGEETAYNFSECKVLFLRSIRLSESRRRRILFVDDDTNVLQGLRRTLRPMRGEWEMEFADGGEAALAILKEEPADVIVTDIRMSGMNGYDFLVAAAKAYPHAVRIVLSGQLDRQNVFRLFAITHQFLAKPCDVAVLKRTVTRACVLRELLTDVKLKCLLSRLKTLPSLPTLFSRLMAELASEDASLKKVAEIISSDIAMSAKILQIVNSAAFGIMRRIKNPREAVTLLGVEAVKAFVLSAGIFQQFDPAKLERFDLDHLWDHSMNVALFTKRILEYENFDSAAIDDTYMIGFVHDVGTLVLVENLPAQYEQALGLSEQKKIPVHAAEREVFGASHAELGAYLLGLWGLPDQVVEAVAYHHAPFDCLVREFGALAAVHFANACDHEINPVTLVDKLIFLADEAYLGEIGVVERAPAWKEACRKIVLEKT